MRDYQPSDVVIFVRTIGRSITRVLRVTNSASVLVEVIVVVVVTEHVRDGPIRGSHPTVVSRRERASVTVVDTLDRSKRSIREGIGVVGNPGITRTADVRYSSGLVITIADLRIPRIGDAVQLAGEIVAVGQSVRAKTRERTRLGCRLSEVIEVVAD